jgi:RHS repeat-associated protein
LVRFSATVKSDPQAKPHALVEAVRAAMPKNQENDAKLALMQEMTMRMPEQHRKVMERNIEKVLGGTITPLTRNIWSGMGINPDAMIANMRQEVEETKKTEETEITVHYFHCDHLGTPLALTNQLGQIDWAGKYDPWGNIEEEFNPLGLDQPIRLPGQCHDRETGLYYNRYRYYDFSVNAYINQDPIGLRGAVNLYAYVYLNPLRYTDPMGLEVYICSRPADVAWGLVNHMWVKTDTISAGLGANPNIRPGDEYDAPYITQTYVIDHSKDTPTACEKMNNVDENCVNNILNKELGTPQGRFGPYMNCQAYAYSVTNRCRTGPQIVPPKEK